MAIIAQPFGVNNSLHVNFNTILALYHGDVLDNRYYGMELKGGWLRVELYVVSRHVVGFSDKTGAGIQSHLTYLLNFGAVCKK
jgi:hypothetical protein